jgi:hypothetical protein
MKTFPHKLRRIKIDGQEDKIELFGPAIAILTTQEATNLAVELNCEATRAKHDFIDYEDRMIIKLAQELNK